MRGKEQQELDYADAGDIAAVAKLQYTQTGDTLCDKNNVVRYMPLEYPSPCLYMAIEPVDKKDEDKNKKEEPKEPIKYTKISDDTTIIG